MITMQEVVDWVNSELPVEFKNKPMVPGPRMPDDPNMGAKFQRIEGSGLSVEYLFDSFGFIVEVQSEQNDYASGEAFINAIDKVVIGQGGSRMVGSWWVGDAQRFGGSPTEIDTDDADRYHFQCIYALDVEARIV